MARKSLLGARKVFDSVITRDVNLTRQKQYNMMGLLTVLHAFNKNVRAYHCGTTLLQWYNMFHVILEVHAITDTTLFSYLRDMVRMKILTKSLIDGYVPKYDLILPLNVAYERLLSRHQYAYTKRIRSNYVITQKQQLLIKQQIFTNLQLYKTTIQGIDINEVKLQQQHYCPELFENHLPHNNPYSIPKPTNILPTVSKTLTFVKVPQSDIFMYQLEKKRKSVIKYFKFMLLINLFYDLSKQHKVYELAEQYYETYYYLHDLYTEYSKYLKHYNEKLTYSKVCDYLTACCKAGWLKKQEIKRPQQQRIMYSYTLTNTIESIHAHIVKLGLVACRVPIVSTEEQTIKEA